MDKFYKSLSILLLIVLLASCSTTNSEFTHKQEFSADEKSNIALLNASKSFTTNFDNLDLILRKEMLTAFEEKGYSISLNQKTTIIDASSKIDKLVSSGKHDYIAVYSIDYNTEYSNFLLWNTKSYITAITLSIYDENKKLVHSKDYIQEYWFVQNLMPVIGAIGVAFVADKPNDVAGGIFLGSVAEFVSGFFFNNGQHEDSIEELMDRIKVDL